MQEKFQNKIQRKARREDFLENDPKWFLQFLINFGVEYLFISFSFVFLLQNKKYFLQQFMIDFLVCSWERSTNCFKHYILPRNYSKIILKL